MLAPARAAAARAASAAATAAGSRASRQACRRAICSASTAGSTTRMPPSPAVSGEGSASVKRLTPTTVVAPASMRARRAVLAVDERGLHVVDGGDGAAHLVDAGELGAGAGLQLLDLGGDGGVAVEEVAVFEEVGLVGHDLLHAERPLLVPGAGEAEGLVPGRELDGAGAGVLREGDGEHLDEDAVDVVLRLLLGQAEGVDLHAVAEAAELAGRRRRSASRQISSQSSTKARILHISVTKRMPAFTKKEMRETSSGKSSGVDLGADLVEDGAGGGEREGELLLGRRAGLLQVVAADVHRVPLRHRAVAVLGDVGDELQRGLGREDVGAAGEVFLDDVVLDGALELGEVGALLLGGGDVEGEEPGGGGVDRHRGVHRLERDAVEEGAHVAEVGDGDADLADLAAGEGVVAVVAGLGGQVEGDREAGLAAGEVGAVERVRGGGGGMAGVGAEEPGLVAGGFGHSGASGGEFDADHAALQTDAPDLPATRFRMRPRRRGNFVALPASGARRRAG